MLINALSRKSKSNQSFAKKNFRKDLVTFVTGQFKELLKKNLQVPIKLYQL